MLWLWSLAINLLWTARLGVGDYFSHAVNPSVHRFSVLLILNSEPEGFPRRLKAGIAEHNLTHAQEFPEMQGKHAKHYASFMNLLIQYLLLAPNFIFKNTHKRRRSLI